VGLHQPSLVIVGCESLHANSFCCPPGTQAHRHTGTPSFTARARDLPFYHHTWWWHVTLSNQFCNCNKLSLTCELHVQPCCPPVTQALRPSPCVRVTLPWELQRATISTTITTRGTPAQRFRGCLMSRCVKSRCC
jgi:hypothetical protein